MGCSGAGSAASSSAWTEAGAVTGAGAGAGAGAGRFRRSKTTGGTARPHASAALRNLWISASINSCRTHPPSSLRDSSI